MSVFVQALEDIEYFGVGPQFYWLLKQQGKLEFTPPFFRDGLKQHFHAAVSQNLYIKYEMETMLRAFDEAGIPVIPLKGIPFSEKVFGHMGARATTDIDLLIKKEDLERARACVWALGYVIEGERYTSHFHESYAKPIAGSPIPLAVEIHWDLLTQHTSDFDISELWADAMPDDRYKHVSHLSDYHTLYSICLHGWKHAMNSMKYVMDIVQILQLQGHSMDYSALLVDAQKHRTNKRLLRTLSIVYRLFPHLQQDHPLPIPPLSPLWWDYDTIRGTHTKSPLQYIRLLLYLWSDYDRTTHRIASIYQYIRTLRTR